MILAIDPGPFESAFCFYDQNTQSPEMRGKVENQELIKTLRNSSCFEVPLAIEMIASYGMPVGKEVFETCVWIGKFLGAHQGRQRLVYRKDVKMHLCNSMKANDATIRQALIDRFGPPGTKKAPGKLYGFKSDMWAALAVALTAAETEGTWELAL